MGCRGESHCRGMSEAGGGESPVFTLSKSPIPRAGGRHGVGLYMPKSNFLNPNPEHLQAKASFPQHTIPML